MTESTRNFEKYIEINKQQKEFYNARKKNVATRVWSAIRNGLLSNFRKKYDIKKRVYEEHKRWMGNLENKKVLDLGCLYGNNLSFYMAQNAKEYIGIDLSDKAINSLAEKLRGMLCPNAKVMAIDFLSPEFKEKDFDLIYAYGVLHHFQDFNTLINRLKEKLNHGGHVICYDPLQTSLPIRILRLIYRPFQSDRHWEWPFSKETIIKLQSNFHIIQLHGILGISKWSFLINILPLRKKTKNAIIQNLIEKDWNISSVDKKLYRCMHVTIHFGQK